SRLNPEWKLLATVDGEVSIFPRARIATLEIPLARLAAPGDPPLELESGDVRLRAQRIGSRALPAYGVELVGPGDVTVMPADDSAGSPVLLDAQKRPVRAPVRAPARSVRSPADRPIGVAITFTEPEGTPAFLRLPVVFRYGKPV